MELTYWYLFPISIVIAWLANGAGIGGATFFSPLFILALGLEPTVAIGAGPLAAQRIRGVVLIRSLGWLFLVVAVITLVEVVVG